MSQSISLSLFLAVMLLFNSTGWAADATMGEQIFQQRCTACHTIGKGRLVGPDLQGVTARRSEAWLVKFIRNSQALIQEGDEEAKKVFEEFKVPMPPQDLTDAQMADLLAFLKQHEEAATAAASSAGEQDAVAAEWPRSEEAMAKAAMLKSSSFHTLFWVVTAGVVLIYFGIAFVISGLSRGR